MEEDDFDDLLAGVEFAHNSSQESLTTAVTDLFMFDDGCNTIPSATSTEFSAVEDPRTSMYGEEQAAACFSFGDHSGRDAVIDDRPCLRHARMLEKIGEIFDQLADDLMNERPELVITLKSKPTTREAAKERAHQPTQKFRRICFPGKTAQEAWRFTVIIRILQLIHEALSNDKVISKRDIYYGDPALFGNQTHVNRYIDAIALTLSTPRSSLNIAAVAKGLITGAALFTRRNGSTLSIASSSEGEGTLVPNLQEILCVNLDTVKWILVVEKEASFRSIASSAGFRAKLAEHGVLITGKGYPDIATRALLHFLATPSPRNGFRAPPVYGLVDYDPDGLAILSTYKDGSIALAHESEALRVPGLRWLGLRAEHIGREGGGLHSDQGLLSLTSRDRRKAVKMLERAREVDGECEMRQALQGMLMLNLKAELQLLDAQAGGMVELLEAGLRGEE